MVNKIIQSIQQHSIPLTNFKDDLDPLISAITNQKYILLGESSHGTAEFYQTRAEITKRLILEKDFTFIAVEGDWPACQQVNSYIKGYSNEHKNARDVLASFKRWPTWMWANEEIIDLIEWLKEFNQEKRNEKKVGFYGIDIYSLWESMDEILKYLEKETLLILRSREKPSHVLNLLIENRKSMHCPLLFITKDVMKRSQSS